jgi:hypothetical protein
MPLQNHLVPPLRVTHPRTDFHSAWATVIAQMPNQDGVLPPRFYAVPNVLQGGPIKIDVAALQDANGATSGHAAEEFPLWTPPAPTLTAFVGYSTLNIA